MKDDYTILSNAYYKLFWATGSIQAYNMYKYIEHTHNFILLDSNTNKNDEELNI